MKLTEAPQGEFVKVTHIHRHGDIVQQTLDLGNIQIDDIIFILTSPYIYDNKVVLNRKVIELKYDTAKDIEVTTNV